MNKNEFQQRLRQIYLKKNITKDSWSKISSEEINNLKEGSLAWILIKIITLEDELCLSGREENLSPEAEKSLLFLERVCGVNY